MKITEQVAQPTIFDLEDVIENRDKIEYRSIKRNQDLSDTPLGHAIALSRNEKDYIAPSRQKDLAQGADEILTELRKTEEEDRFDRKGPSNERYVAEIEESFKKFQLDIAHDVFNDAILHLGDVNEALKTRHTLYTEFKNTLDRAISNYSLEDLREDKKLSLHSQILEEIKESIEKSTIVLAPTQGAQRNINIDSLLRLVNKAEQEIKNDLKIEEETFGELMRSYLEAFSPLFKEGFISRKTLRSVESGILNLKERFEEIDKHHDRLRELGRDLDKRDNKQNDDLDDLVYESQEQHRERDALLDALQSQLDGLGKLNLELLGANPISSDDEAKLYKNNIAKYQNQMTSLMRQIEDVKNDFITKEKEEIVEAEQNILEILRDRQKEDQLMMQDRESRRKAVEGCIEEFLDAIKRGKLSGAFASLNELADLNIPEDLIEPLRDKLIDIQRASLKQKLSDLSEIKFNALTLEDDHTVESLVGLLKKYTTNLKAIDFDDDQIRIPLEEWRVLIKEINQNLPNLEIKSFKNTALHQFLMLNKLYHGEDSLQISKLLNLFNTREISLFNPTPADQEKLYDKSTFSTLIIADLGRVLIENGNAKNILSGYTALRLVNIVSNDSTETLENILGNIADGVKVKVSEAYKNKHHLPEAEFTSLEYSQYKKKQEGAAKMIQRSFRGYSQRRGVAKATEISDAAAEFQKEHLDQTREVADDSVLEREVQESEQAQLEKVNEAPEQKKKITPEVISSYFEEGASDMPDYGRRLSREGSTLEDELGELGYSTEEFGDGAPKEAQKAASIIQRAFRKKFQKNDQNKGPQEISQGVIDMSQSQLNLAPKDNPAIEEPSANLFMEGSNQININYDNPGPIEQLEEQIIEDRSPQHDDGNDDGKKEIITQELPKRASSIKKGDTGLFDDKENVAESRRIGLSGINPMIEKNREKYMMPPVDKRNQSRVSAPKRTNPHIEKQNNGRNDRTYVSSNRVPIKQPPINNENPEEKLKGMEGKFGDNIAKINKERQFKESVRAILSKPIKYSFLQDKKPISYDKESIYERISDQEGDEYKKKQKLNEQAKGFYIKNVRRSKPQEVLYQKFVEIREDLIKKTHQEILENAIEPKEARGIKEYDIGEGGPLIESINTDGVRRFNIDDIMQNKGTCSISVPRKGTHDEEAFDIIEIVDGKLKTVILSNIGETQISTDQVEELVKKHRYAQREVGGMDAPYK